MTKNQPRVSIIVPVYNVAKHLPKCLDSIASQTIKNKDVMGVKKIRKFVKNMFKKTIVFH